MSLVPTFVLADDGKFYKNPTVRSNGTPNWFLCFDDRDPPEFAMRVYGPTKPETVERSVEGILCKLGISAEIVAARRSQRMFGDKFHNAIAFSLKITRPMPSALLQGCKPYAEPDCSCAVEMCGGKLSALPGATP